MSDSGFQSLAGFGILRAGFWIPKPRILDFKSEKCVDSGIRIPLHGASMEQSELNEEHVFARLVICPDSFEQFGPI